jgi:hypothetical protein
MLQIVLAVGLLIGLDGSGAVSCASVADDRARLACYDAIFRATASSGAEPVSAAAAATAAASVTAPGVATGAGAVAPAAAVAKPSPEAGFGMTAAQREQKEARSPASVDSITSRIVEVKLRAYGRVTIRLENGQVWDQVESLSGQRFVAGDEVTIRKASLGSYLAKGPRSGLVRVRRVE